MRRTAGLAVGLVVLMLAGAAVAVPTTAGHVAPATSDGADRMESATVASTTAPQVAQLELQQAFSGETDTDVASIEFTASSNTTVTAPLERTQGEVTFRFERWSGNGDAGTDNEFRVVPGETYEVEYEATGTSQGESGTDGTRSVYISRSGGMTGYLEADVQYVEPRFGSTDAGSPPEVRFEGS